MFLTHEFIERPRPHARGEGRGSIHTGAHEVLVVESARGERLLPYVPAYVVSLDLAAQQLIYDAPPGLLDLDEAEEA